MSKPVILEILNKIKNLTDKVENDMYYKAGDIFSCTKNHGYSSAGSITGSKKSLIFSIHTPKSLKNITSISTSSFKFNVRVNGAYAGGGNNFDYATSDKYSIALTKVDDFTISVNITSTDDIHATNNISATVDFVSFNIELE